MICAVPAETPVTVKEPEVLPAAMKTGEGETVTTPAGAAFRFTETPGTGAGPLKVTVPLTVFVRPTVLLDREIEIVGVPTFTTAVPGR